MDKRKGIIWFRQDLRLHDNEALTEAIKYCESVIPVYVFDERVFSGMTKSGFPKTNKYRLKFILESIKDLRNSLQNLGSNLIIRIGKPEVEILKIARKCKTSWVFCNRERTHEEEAVQDALEKNLWSVGQEIRFSRGKMLYYTADLPFPITHTPDIFSHFRKEVERFVKIRAPLPSPHESISQIPENLDIGKLPDLETFGYLDFEYDKRVAYHFKGGESEALKRLDIYFKSPENQPLEYKNSKNSLFHTVGSTKLSPWLAQGCLSPKLIYQKLLEFEANFGKDKSTTDLFHELMYRDFLRFMGKKHGNNIFRRGGIIEKPNNAWKNDMTIFQIWKDGRTGIPFVDAIMKELNLTGYISNIGRRNAASFLVNNLNINWQIGAEYFESLLIDYDPCSNWVNWNLIAGIGDDHKEDRKINVLSQAKKFDPHGEYVKTWLPELKDLPNDKIHKLNELSDEDQNTLNFKPGYDYPKAMVSIF